MISKPSSIRLELLSTPGIREILIIPSVLPAFVTCHRVV